MMAKRTERRKVVLGFRAFDLHELLPHFVAHRLGYYRQNGLEVTLKDVNFLPEEQRDVPLTVACGAALMGWMKGLRSRVIFVTTDYPMFWLHAQPAVREVRALRGLRVATYPSIAPPAHFHRKVLSKYGLDPDRDVLLEPARDDVARLGLLKSGDVHAALISSAIPPPKVQSFGLRTILFFGDEIRVPTTGLAVLEEFVSSNSELVQDMVAAFHQSILAIHQFPEKVIPIVTQVLGDSPKMAEQTYDLLRDYFTRNGRAAPEAERSALEFANQHNPNEKKLRPDDIYDYSFLPG